MAAVRIYKKPMEHEAKSIVAGPSFMSKIVHKDPARINYVE